MKFKEMFKRVFEEEAGESVFDLNNNVSDSVFDDLSLAEEIFDIIEELQTEEDLEYEERAFLNLIGNIVDIVDLDDDVLTLILSNIIQIYDDEYDLEEGVESDILSQLEEAMIRRVRKGKKRVYKKGYRKTKKGWKKIKKSEMLAHKRAGRKRRHKKMKSSTKMKIKRGRKRTYKRLGGYIKSQSKKH